MKQGTTDTCALCGGAVRRRLVHEYEDELLGLPGVVLVDSVEVGTCAKCGEEFTSIPNLAGLIATAALARVKVPVKLNPAEVRFIRKALAVSRSEPGPDRDARASRGSMKAAELADLLEVRPETISRWENGKEPIGPTSEKLLRLTAWIKLRHEAPLITFDDREIADMKLKSVRSQKKPVRIALSRRAMPRGTKRKEQIGWDENGRVAAHG